MKKKPTESYCPLTAEILAFGSENRERDARAIYMYTYVCNKYYGIYYLRFLGKNQISR